jgi:hypothetical protein
MKQQSNLKVRFRAMFIQLALLTLLVTVCGCAKHSQAVSSPDGSLELVTSVERSNADPKTYLCVVFEIRDRAGKVLHKENTRASDVSKWSMAWISTNKIQLDSSDIGTYVWEKQPDGTWKKN